MIRILALATLAFVLLAPVWSQESHPPAGESHPVAQTHGETAHGDPSHANGEHGEGGHGSALGGEHATLWKTANFLILVGLAVYFLRGKVGPFFAAHTQSIAKGMATAAAKAEDAEQRLAAMEAKLANLDVEIAALREHAAVEMQRDRERIQQETSAAIERLQERAEAEIRSAAAQAQAQLRHQAASLALGLAESQVRAEAAAPEVQEQLLTQAVAKLNRVGQASRN